VIVIENKIDAGEQPQQIARTYLINVFRGGFGALRTIVSSGFSSF
jgi:hypothetical protein